MPARSPYPAITNVFQRIRIDGEELSGVQAYDRYNGPHERLHAEWVGELRQSLLQLCMHGGGLRASTSGTTGPPKRYTIPRRDLVHSARLTGSSFGLLPGDRVLHCLPCNFIAGKMMLVRAFALQLDIHFIDPRGSVLHNLKVTDRFRFTAMVPLQLHRAIQEDRARVERQFDTILLGGGPVGQALAEDLADLRVNVFQSYGSTETVTHVALRRLGQGNALHPGETPPCSSLLPPYHSPNDPFQAIGEVQFGRDPRGCLVVYTPHLSTSQHITNDMVELLDDTHFRWLGRHDNVILSGGKKIFPEQLEARTVGLISYPHYYTAVPDDRLGQAVMLVLETDQPQEEIMPEVLEKIMATLHPHEWPRRVQALKKIKRTASGKMIRA